MAGSCEKPKLNFVMGDVPTVAPPLDERADEACFVLALALRRIQGIEPLDAEDEDEDDAEMEDDDTMAADTDLDR